MKTAIQTYGLIFGFSIMFLIIIQLLNFSIYYTKLNSISSYLVEVIEVNEGVNEKVLNEISKFDNDTIKISYTKNNIDSNYIIYQITAKANLHLFVIGANYNLQSSKFTRRVIY